MMVKLTIFLMTLRIIWSLNSSASKTNSFSRLTAGKETLMTLFDSVKVVDCFVKDKTEEEMRIKNISSFLTNYSSINSSEVELSCDENYIEHTLKEEEFEVNEEGNLYDTVHNAFYDASMYCLKRINNQSNDNESQIKWEAKVCQLSTVSVYRCCFRNGEDCVGKRYDFDSSIKIQDITKDIKVKYEPLRQLKCSNNKSIASTSIGNSSISLIYRNKRVQVILSENESTANYCLDKSDYENESDSLYYCTREKVSEEIPPNCEKNNCIRKCCPESHLYDSSQRKCVYVSEYYEWKPKFYTPNTLEPSVEKPNISFVHGFPMCKNYFLLQPHANEKDKFYILENGRLFVVRYNEAFRSDLFCSDYFRHDSEIREESLLCFPEENTKRFTGCEKIRTFLKPIFMILSSLFLILTLLVYGVLPDLSSKINGKCVISSTSALLMAFICLIIMEWGSGRTTMTSCQLLGIFTQFFSLSSFFWLNVMCFDVWRALRSQRHVTAVSIYSAKRRFLKYSLYAWGLPLCISIVSTCMQFLLKANSQGRPLTPGFGITGCFFPNNDPRPSWAYFYGFISVLMAINVFFFVHLLVMLHRERLRNDTALHRTNKQHVVWIRLYLKLFCVMGVTWIFEIISWTGGSCSLWIWTDSLNALRGLFIFLIFVCKRTILHKLKKRSAIVSLKTMTSSLTKPSSSSGNSRSSSKKVSTQFFVDIEVNESAA